MSGALDESVFDGITILLKINEENDKHRYLYISGDMICSFLSNGNFYEHISNIGNDLTPYSIALRHGNLYFLTPLFKFIKREKNIDNELLKTIKSSADSFDNHVSNCGKYFFIKLRKYKNHSNYD